MRRYISASLLLIAFAVSSHVANATPLTPTLPENSEHPSVTGAAPTIASVTGYMRDTAMLGGLASLRNEDLSATLSGSFERLAAGQSVRVATPINGAAPAIWQRNVVSVNASFTRRPIGGILNISVSIVPAFTGIGTASRSLITKQFASAVEDFDQDLIDERVADLVAEMRGELSSRIASVDHSK